LFFSFRPANSWAFGRTQLATGFLVELAIEPLPFGQHSLPHIDWTELYIVGRMLIRWQYDTCRSG
jgi:hypothetical protein